MPSPAEVLRAGPQKRQKAECYPRQVNFGIRGEDPCGEADAELDNNDEQDHYTYDFLNFHAKHAGFRCDNAKIEKKKSKNKRNLLKFDKKFLKTGPL